MDLYLIIGGIVIFIIVVGIGGGLAFWFFVASREKKMTWDAEVYQVGDESIKHGNYELSPLVPYTTDIIEKIEKKNGATHYWLTKMKKAAPVVTADCVEKWKDKKKVKVLLEEDTCTLLKASYDRELGRQIFKPLPHDRVNMMRTEVSERKERVQDKKDILAALAPYLVTGLWALTLVIVTYLVIQGTIKVAEFNDQGSEKIQNSLNYLGNVMLTVYGYNPQDLNTNESRPITKADPPIPSPP